MSPSPPETIEIERLQLERFSEANLDFETYHEVVSAPEMDEITEYLFWDRPRSREDSRALFDTEIQRWEEGSKLTFVVRPVGDDDLPADERSSFAGLTKLFVDDDRSVGELGIWLRRRFQGRGYAGERVEPLLDLAFSTLALAMVEVHVTDGNDHSRHGVERYVEEYGGRYEGLLRRSATAGYYETEVVDQHRYTISREEYEAATASENQGQ